MEQKYDWYTVLFSMLDGAITDAQRDQLQALKASWVIVNRRLGRLLIDILGPRNELVAIRDKLIELGRDPKMIAVWDADGVIVQRGATATVDWLAVAEDVLTYDAAGNLISTTRPVAFRDTHRWAGWAQKEAA